MKHKYRVVHYADREKFEEWLINWGDLGYKVVYVRVLSNIFGIVKGYLALMERTDHSVRSIV